MSAVGIYDFAGQSIRVVDGDDGEPRFVVADVARLLGYRDAANAARILKPHQAGYSGVSTPSGEQRMVVCTESGLNRLLLRSNASNAEQVQEWIESDVMPSIRRTGGYAQPRPDVAAITRADLARMVLESEAAREAAEARAVEATERVEQLEPAAAAWQHLASSDGDHSVGDAAKILSRAPGVTIGQKRLFGLLKEWRWLYRDSGDNWHPYQAHVDNGRLAQRAMSHHHPRTGELVIDAPQVRITGKGLSDIHARLARPLAVVSA